MSRLTDLIAQVKAKDPSLGLDLEREFKALSARRAFGFELQAASFLDLSRSVSAHRGHRQDRSRLAGAGSDGAVGPQSGVRGLGCQEPV